MKRVVITGVGIVSSLGNNKEDVTASLFDGRSGIVAAPEYVENGLRSQIHGAIKILKFSDLIDRNISVLSGDCRRVRLIFAMKQQ